MLSNSLLYLSILCDEDKVSSCIVFKARSTSPISIPKPLNLLFKASASSSLPPSRNLFITSLKFVTSSVEDFNPTLFKAVSNPDNWDLTNRSAPPKRFSIPPDRFIVFPSTRSRTPCCGLSENLAALPKKSLYLES